MEPAMQLLHRAGFVLSKNAPTILTTAGVAGFIASTVLTIRSTSKAVDALPEISANVAKAKAMALDEDFSEQDRQAALVKVYLESSIKLARIYSPTLIVGSASVFCVLHGHGMMMKRQASLLAAYTALDASYKAYRRRIVETIGEEKELELYRSPKLTHPEDKTLPCEIDTGDVMPSPYARFFDEVSPNWTRNPEYNLLFLRSQQDYANDRLKAHGFVFLNEVYESLGFPRSQAGQVVGWKINSEGDNFIDFGLYSIFDESSRAFVNGVEHTVLLDFNVDGPIRI